MPKVCPSVFSIRYQVNDGDRTIDFDPTCEEIEQAIADRDFVDKPHHGREEELNREWIAAAKGDINEAYRQQRLHHARRIAYFVVHGWADPVEVRRSNGTVKGGTHRIRAAQCVQRPESR